MAQALQLVIDHNHKPVTTSRLVADKFGKNHADVLDAVRQLTCSQEFRLRNFTESSYFNKQNRKMPEVIMTRDGFTFLVMGFTGLSAGKFKEEYIEQFNTMEAAIRSTAPTALPTYSNRILSEPTRCVPRGYWSVFDKSHKVMLLVEKYVGSINQYDLVDGSIGIHWSKYRLGQPWQVLSVMYPHEYDDNRGTVMCKCYPKSEGDYFDDWLEDVYIPTLLYRYLQTKYSGNPTMLRNVEKLLPRLLKAS